MSSRTRALEAAIEKMVAKLEEYPSTPYTRDATESLANAMHALEKSYKIDEMTGNTSMKLVIPTEIAELLGRINSFVDEGDVRFNAAEIFSDAKVIDARYGAMLDRSIEVEDVFDYDPRPENEGPEDPAENIPVPMSASEQTLARQIEAAASPDPPRTVLDPETGIEEPVTTGRIPDAEFVEPPLMAPAASPDERLREALESISTGSLSSAAAAVIARNALAAADREAPDERVHRESDGWPLPPVRQKPISGGNTMIPPIHDIRSIVQVVREGGAYWGVYYLDGSDAGQAWAFFNTENDARVFAASLPRTQEPSSYAAVQYGERSWKPDPRVFRIEAGDNVCGEPDRNEVERTIAEQTP